jgi:hypothetical protein
MVDPAGDHPTGLEHLLEEAQVLRVRLHRIALALSITEDLAAELLEQMAEPGGATAPSLRVTAQRARATAHECRTFAEHLADLHADI